MILADSQVEQYGSEYVSAVKRGVLLGTFENYVNAKLIGQEQSARFDRLEVGPDDGQYGPWTSLRDGKIGFKFEAVLKEDNE